jgi:hypothetical protein
VLDSHRQPDPLYNARPRPRRLYPSDRGRHGREALEFRRLRAADLERPVERGSLDRSSQPARGVRPHGPRIFHGRRGAARSLNGARHGADTTPRSQPNPPNSASGRKQI